MEIIFFSLWFSNEKIQSSLPLFDNDSVEME